jgi:hypothetical protein
MGNMRIKTPLFIASVAALAAGCGSSNPPASAGRSSGSPADAAYKYARCIREHGVPGFPDPQVSSSPGETSVAQMLPKSVASSPRFKSAQRACRGIVPGPGSQGSSDQLAHKSEFLAFARCVRAHGVSGFPDPNSRGQITPQMLSSAGVDFHSQAFLPGAIKCVGVTHGAITPADIRAAASGPH